MRGVDMKAYITRFQKSHLLTFCLFALMSLAMLTACGSEKVTQPYDVTYNGKTYTVDQVQQTITVDGEVCHYEIESRGSIVNFHVTYPDGSIYWWQEDQYGGMGGWNYGYDPERYVSGETLWEVLELDHSVERSASGKYVAPGLLLILLGVVNAAFPRAMWYLSYGWRFKNAEPSDAALLVGRAGGAVVAVAGVICLFL